MKCHLKSFVVPKSWTLSKKDRVFAVRPKPGAHKADFSVPVANMLRSLGIAQTIREIKQIMNSKAIIIDGQEIKDYKRPVGFMDGVNIPLLGKSYRVVVDDKGKLKYLEVTAEELAKKLARVESKMPVKGGKIQLNLSDGRNLLSDVKCKVGDSVLMEIPAQRIVDVLPLQKGAVICLIKGRHTGTLGVVEDIKDNRLWFKVGKDTFETLKEYGFVVGKNAPVLKVQ